MTTTPIVQSAEQPTVAPNCDFCGSPHPGMKCPLVKGYSYAKDGGVTHVEFFSPRELRVQLGEGIELK